eukprot:13024224-Alexandrium_andersonii.AAC.1
MPAMQWPSPALTAAHGMARWTAARTAVRLALGLSRSSPSSESWRRCRRRPSSRPRPWRARARAP